MDGIGAASAAVDQNISRAQSATLLAHAESDAGSRDNAKILKAGHDFESILLGSWLQGAESTFAAAPGGASDDDDEDGTHDQFTGMAMQHLASSMVDAGGIGIARMIAEHLAQKAGHPAAQAKTAPGHERS